MQWDIRYGGGLHVICISIYAKYAAPVWVYFA